MSFRSTFTSPGGFTTQRLDLILKKRKDGGVSADKSPTGVENSTTSSSSTSTKNTSSSVGKRPSSMTENSNTSRGAGESALDRWRKKMADQGFSSHERSPATSPTRTSTPVTSSSTLENRTKNSWGEVTRTFSSVDPRRKLDFNSNVEPVGTEEGSVGGRNWTHSSMSLPRRRAERSGVGGMGTIGSRLRGNHVKGTSVSSSHLERTAPRRNNQRGEGVIDPRGSITSLNIPPERSLTSRRFQALFSSTDSEGEEQEEGDDSGDDYPDSLEEDGDMNDVGGPSLKRSASSASTVLRGSGWTPASRLRRDRYESGATVHTSTSSKAPGTRSNWAAWRGDLHKGESILNNKSRTDSKPDRTESNSSIGKALVKNIKSDNISSNNGDGVTIPESLEESRVTATPAPLPATLHLTAFPGYAGGVKPRDSARSGHWGGHVPQAAVGYTPPEWYLYKGSASVSPAPDPRHALEKGSREGADPRKGTAQVKDGPPRGVQPRQQQTLEVSVRGATTTTRLGNVSHQKGDVIFAKPERTVTPRNNKDVYDTSIKSAPEESHHGGQDHEVRGTFSEHDSVFSSGDQEQEPAAPSRGTAAPWEPDGDGHLCVKVADGLMNGDYTRLGKGNIEGAAINIRGGAGGGGGIEEGGVPVLLRGGTPPPPPLPSQPLPPITGQTGNNTAHNRQHSKGQQVRPPTVPDTLYAPRYSHPDLYHPPGTLPQPDLLTEVFLAPTDPPASKATESTKHPASNAAIRTAVKPTDLTGSVVLTPKNKPVVGSNVAAPLDRESSAPRADGVGSAAPGGRQPPHTPTVAPQDGTPAELALRSPRVSFCDDLKVVPASPSPERKNWQAPEAAAAIGDPVGGDSAEGAAGTDTSISVATTAAAEAAPTTPTSPHPRPWEVAGRTPVKGILQNGRKEGEVVHRPAPDDSEMRTQEDSGGEGRRSPSTLMSVSGGPVSKRHSFSSSRDVPHTYKRYISKTVCSGSSSSGTQESAKTPQKAGSGTPTMGRRGVRGPDAGGTLQSGYKAPSRSASMRSGGVQRSSWSTRHRGGGTGGGDVAGRGDGGLPAPRDVKASPAVQRQRKIGQGMRGSTDSLNTSRTYADRHSTYDTRTKMRGSTDSLSGHTDRDRRDSRSTDKERRDSRSYVDRERRNSRSSLDRNKQGHDTKPKCVGSKGSTDSVSGNCDRERRDFRSLDKNRHESRTTDKEVSESRTTVTEARDSHNTEKDRQGSKSTTDSVKQTRESRLSDKDSKNDEKPPTSGKDQNSSSFTLSFKDFMEQRKKQGTCVLPHKSQDKSGKNVIVEGSGTNRRVRTRSESSTESSCSQREGCEGGSVTLSSLKEIRDREGKRRKHSGDNHGAKGVSDSEGSKTTQGPDDVQESPFKRKEESGHRWSFRSRKKKHSEQEGVGESSSVSRNKKEQGVGTVLSNFFKRSKRGSKRNTGESSFYLNPADDSKKDGANGGDVDVEGQRTSQLEGNREESKTGSTGHTDSENGAEERRSQAEAGDGECGFTLGPHGHSDSERDPLSALFTKTEAGDDERDDTEPADSARKDGSNTADADGAKPASRAGVERSPVGLLLDMVGSPSDSPALSAISSVDEGTGMAPPGGRNRHYERPASDYKQFLDMDSLVASITTNNRSNETPTESSSGISANTSRTGSDSASGLGSLEDLAMALLESELREEGLLEGEPGLPEPAQDYQGRIQGIKADLHKFSIHVGRSLKKHKHGDSSERAPSVSDLSVTSTRSSRSPWLRDVTVDAKPISDPLLRNKLKSARSPGARVTSRDQKILELMMAKREEEKAAEKKRLAARRTWELQKQHEDAAKTSADLRRRESLVRQRQQKDITKGRRHTDSTDSLHSTYSERPDDHDTDCEDAHRYKDRQWSSQSQKITELRPSLSGLRHGPRTPQSPRSGGRDMLTKYRSVDDMQAHTLERPWVSNGLNSPGHMVKEKKMAERRMQNMQRKKSQEDRVAAQKQDQEDVMKMVRERQERELKRANSLKESKEHEALMQRKLKNYYMKKRHDERMDNLKRKSREDIHTLQSAIAMKQATAQSHLQAIQTRKYSELRRSTTDLDTRICRSKENQQRLQEEMSAWHEDLHNYRKMMEKRAEEQAKIAVAQKAKRAAEERCNKEKLQKKNFKKLLAQEEEWKADVEASIAIKDAKTRMLQMEKDETMQESRAMAAASQRMREELRSAYSSDTIDQLSKQAQLQAKLGLESYSVNAGLSGTTKNMSTLTLG